MAEDMVLKRFSRNYRHNILYGVAEPPNKAQREERLRRALDRAAGDKGLPPAITRLIIAFLPSGTWVGGMAKHHR